MQRNPWRTLEVREIYANDWLRLDEDRVINPSGRENRYAVVRFKNHAIGILPVDEAGHTWLVGQWRYALRRYSWEIPMGGHPVSENPLAGAKRELEEETGLTAAHWTELMRLHTSNSVTDELGIVYIARQLSQGAPRFGETEQLTLRRLLIDDAVKLALEGEITDAISVAALLKFAAVGGR
jgi:8-oxo-dGTP pyrophosphatase MutT (NUDIX family)